MRFNRLSWVVCLILSGGVALTYPIATAQPTDSVPADRENLALNRPSTASSTQDDSRWPGAAVDGDPETRWCASDESFPQWLQVDLGRPETLTGCRIGWEADNTSYDYKLEGSLDGTTWTSLAARIKTDDRQQIRTIPLQVSGIRHVRLTILGSSPGNWASVFEFAVLGTKPAPAVVRSGPARDDAAAVLKEIKVPPGFAATVFAAPPDVHYPTCLAAAPTGTVFVGIDENGSLDAKGDRGRVVRCVDTDNDGTADRFNVFATMDSPRGLIWDAGTLFVLHPPSLSAFYDTDGDGTADRTEVLVRGIGFDLKHRGADHTTNGIRLGIDGFLYIAVGDYGFVQAQGKDGDPIQLLGGGVARVRTDGTGLAVVSRGQRNIYDVAIDPQMNLFTRDNTNDGDGWDVRLSHVVPTGNYGYPSLFKRFPAEILPPMADYGGGSPCGSIFLQEPGFPAGFGNTLYTCEWGRGAVFMHPLTPQGATFVAKQETFVTIPRPTDIDVDGLGRIFISSWRDGGFTYSKSNVGYIIRVTPENLQPEPFLDLAHADRIALVHGLTGDSSVLRLAAQREILRRGVDDATAQILETAIEAAQTGSNGRIAALFTLAQGRGPQADAFLIRTATLDSAIREFAITALGNRHPADANIDAITPTLDRLLTDPAPRVRLAAEIAAGRLGATSAAGKLIGLTSDSDPVVAHAAIKALVQLRATATCLDGLATGSELETRGAARALQEMHATEIIPRLIQIAADPSRPTARQAALEVLCRLYFTESPYVAGQWWGTRPDTSGPYYKPTTWAGSEPIIAALRATLRDADPTLQRWLLAELIRTKIDLEDTTAVALRSADADPALRGPLVDLMVARPHLSHAAIAFLTATCTRPDTGETIQLRAIRGLLKHQNEPNARDAALGLLASLGGGVNPGADLVSLWTEFARDNRRGRDVATFVPLLTGTDDARGTLAAAVLLAVAANSKAPEAARSAVDAAIERGWTQPVIAARLLRAIGLTKTKGYDSRIKSFCTAERPELQTAARFAAERLNLATTTSKPAVPAGKPIGGTAYETVLAATLADQGDVQLGTQLFERVGCVNCHTLTKSAPIKGPYLGDVAARYNRNELVESILKPSARIAQGFETQRIGLVNGQMIEGFVVREAGDEVELRNASGNVVVVPKTEIDERGKGELSVMPQGLLDPLTSHDLASLLAYLDAIKGK